jgi:hypothetical protein
MVAAKTKSKEPRHTQRNGTTGAYAATLSTPMKDGEITTPQAGRKKNGKLDNSNEDNEDQRMCGDNNHWDHYDYILMPPHLTKHLEWSDPIANEDCGFCWMLQTRSSPK